MLSLFLLLIEDEDDKNKFEHIYGKYVNDMYKLALENTGNEMDAKEIISEAFLSVIDNIKIIKTDKEHALRAYLFQIVKNEYYDKLKKDRNAPLSLDNFADISDEADIEKLIIEKEEKEIFRKIISGMPDIYRYALYFKYNEKYSIRDIAKLFDLSEGTARKTLKEGIRYIVFALRKVDKNGKL